MLKLSRNASSLVAGLFFSVSGAMVVTGFRPDLPAITLLEWAFGIFITVAIITRLPISRFR